jgi:hypothetical protein
MSDLEYSKNDVEMMRYRNNKLAYLLGLGGMVFSLLACFMGLNTLTATTANTMVAIMINIVVLLGGFLAIERTKNYNTNGCIATIVFGGVSFARIFYYPLLIIANFNTFRSLVDGSLSGTLTEEEAKTFADAYKMLGPSVTSYYLNEDVANAFFFPNGIARATTMIVMLSISAGMFIAGGVIGFLRARKLNAYLESINQKK